MLYQSGVSNADPTETTMSIPTEAEQIDRALAALTAACDAYAANPNEANLNAVLAADDRAGLEMGREVAS